MHDTGSEDSEIDEDDVVLSTLGERLHAEGMDDDDYFQDSYQKDPDESENDRVQWNRP